MIGTRFGKLQILSLSHRDKHYHSYWNCLCDCGSMKVVCKTELRKGDTKSCGCLKKGRLKTHGKSNTRVYKSWESMITRCNNKDPNSKNYKHYGAKGIKVCNSWLDFQNFYKDMGDRPQGKSLDRLNNSKGYYNNNCKWSTPKEQVANRG